MTIYAFYQYDETLGYAEACGYFETLDQAIDAVVQSWADDREWYIKIAKEEYGAIDAQLLVDGNDTAIWAESEDDRYSVELGFIEPIHVKTKEDK